MSLIHPRRVDLSPEQVADLLHRHYALAGQVTPIPGERDSNFLISQDGAPTFVLKAAWPDEPDEVLALQVALLTHLGHAALDFQVPRPVPSTSGTTLPEETVGNQRIRLRLVSWIPGRLLHETPRTDAQLRDIGRVVGQLAFALRSFGHAGAFREFEWTLAATPMGVARLPMVEESHRGVLERTFSAFASAADRVRHLPHGVVHGDLNDWNLLVDPDKPDRVCGVLDVGDAHFGPRVGDLAVAATYAAMGAQSPLLAISSVVAGYNAVSRLEEDEIALLPLLIRARLATSLSIAAARRHGASAGDEYWFVSEQQGWRLLRYLDGLTESHAIGLLRLSSGLEAARGARSLQEWLGDPAAPLRPILARPLARARCQAIEWTDSRDPMVAATVAGDHAAADAAYRALQDRDAFEVAIGRWMERRAVYAAPAFESRIIPGVRRDTHLGLDLFAAAGTTVYTPLDARVVDVRNVQKPQDYGGVVLLEHLGPGGLPFRTLWGHLDPGSIRHLAPGVRLAAGHPVGALGDASVNGGWVPHLHLQLLLTGEDDPEGVIGVGEWDLRTLWAELYPDPGVLAGIPAEVTSYSESQHSATQALRKQFLPGNLKLSYKSPLHIVRGSDVWLFDHRGRSYLDCYNNVAHVGHARPEVVQAIAAQAARLNTNTRYLHELIGRYAERLRAFMPEPLEVFFFTNSGSEANELALRLARTHTGRREVAVLDWGYHGWTPGLIDVSPYKYKRAGGAGRPEHVIEIPIPPRDWTHAEAAHRLPGTVGALLAETIPSCAGQVVLPQGFLPSLYRQVRSQGGVCIADEVQVGLGRTGAMWAFTEHGVVPDILTLGKPIGNGHPLGAVVTTREIAASFANGMEYFNTFGGNPVSCAAGLAVLDVLSDNDLPGNAINTGGAIEAGLRQMADRHPIIADVRGRGLFMGLELCDPQSGEPRTATAARLVEHAVHHGVLLGTDGPADNVIKIRPPMTFRADHVTILLDVLEEGLRHG